MKYRVYYKNEIIKVLEGDISKYLSSLTLRKDFLRMTLNQKP